MRILMINSVCGIRSTGRICTDLASVLLEQGHDVCIAYGREIAPESFRDISLRMGSSVDFLLHVMKARLSDSSGLGSKRPTQKLIEWIKEYDPDVIHLHNVHGYYLNYQVLFSFLRRINKPIVWTFHDCWVFTGHCSHFDLIGCDKWVSGCNRCPQQREYPRTILFDRSQRNYIQKKEAFHSVDNLTIVTPSFWLKQKVEKSFLRDKECIVIRNGVDKSTFKPTESDIKDRYQLQNKKVILGVSSVWNERKGLDDFVKLSNILTDDYQIVLIGISAIRRKHLVNTRIICIDRTDSPRELAEWYSLAYCFVNLTYEDNFPTVNLEALSCGTPVVTYQTGGSPESIGNKCGIAISQGDIQSVAFALARNNFDRSECLKQSEKFDKKICFGEYVSLYQTKLEKNMGFY